jgi:uncharacterized protein
MNTAYPSTKQSIGIVGVLFGCMILAAPLLLFESVIGKEATFFLYYITSMGVALAAVLKIRQQKNQHRPFDFEIEDRSIIPFIVIATVALAFSVIVPMTSLIPIPDFFKKIFLEMSRERGFFSFLSIVIAAPILEELIFRGIILDGFLKRYSPVKAIVLSSFLFGFVHLNPWQFVGAFTIGIFMGWVYYRTRNIALTIVIHLTHNLLSFVMAHMTEVTMENIDESMVEYYGLIPFILIEITGFAVLIPSLYHLNRQMYLSPEPILADPIADTEAAPVNDSAEIQTEK